MVPVRLLLLGAVCVTRALGQQNDQSPPDLAVKPDAKPPPLNPLHPSYGPGETAIVLQQ